MSYEEDSPEDYNINSADRESFVRLLETVSGDKKYARRVLTFFLSEHFEDITKEAFISSSPKITKVDLAVAGTEYEHTFQEGTKQFEIVPEGKARVKYAFAENGTTGEDHIEADRFATFEERFLNLPAGVKIYYNSDEANTVLKILEWK